MFKIVFRDLVVQQYHPLIRVGGRTLLGRADEQGIDYHVWAQERSYWWFIVLNCKNDRWGTVLSYIQTNMVIREFVTLRYVGINLFCGFVTPR